MELFQILKSLYKRLDNKRRMLLVLVILLSLIGAIAELVSISALVPFLMSLVSSEIKLSTFSLPKNILVVLEYYEIKPITFFAGLFIFLTIVSVLYRTFLVFFQLKIGNSIGHHLSVKAFKSAISSDYESHLYRKPSEISATLTVKIGQIVGSLINPVIFIFTSSVILISIFTLLIFLYGFAVIFIFALIFASYLAIGYWSRSKLLRNSVIVSTRTDRLVSVVQETMMGFKDLIIFKLQSNYLKKYIFADSELRSASVSSNFLSQTPRFILEGVATICFVATIIFISTQDSNIVGLIPFIGVLALAIQRMLPLAQTIFANYATIKSSTASLSDINSIFTNIKKNLTCKKQDQINLIFEKELVLKSIRYSYDSRKKDVLKGVNLKILKGQTIGFFGETASGKSTILDVVSGLLRPTAGVIYLDGVETVLTNRTSWFDNVSVVSQNPFLLDGSIERNITLDFETGIEQSIKLEQAIKCAELVKDLENMPDGLKTNVGQNGAGVSGGQRQRIALARAIYKQYQILILDEATSALDSATEKKIMNNINKLKNKPTIIMVAHRLDTLRNCDIVHEVKNGSIIRSGTYSELLG